ncbi:MAG: energy-coupling factor transporter transmembrane component T family protein [Chloroflexota bacterium]
MNEHSLQFIDNGSIFNRMDALSKIVWVVLVILIALQLQTNTARVLTLAMLLVTTFILARVPLRSFLQSAPIILVMGSLLFLVQLLTVPSTETIHIGTMEFGQAGFDKGLQFFLRVTTIVLTSFIFVWTTNIHDLMVGLVRIGMPYRFAFAVFMSLRFLPIIQQEVDAVQAAHAIRGRAARSPIAHRFRLWQRYLFTVIVNGLRKAENTALAIESRGFGAYPTRTYVKPYRLTFLGVLIVTLFLLLGIALILWERGLLAL